MQYAIKLNWKFSAFLQLFDIHPDIAQSINNTFDELVDLDVTPGQNPSSERKIRLECEQILRSLSSRLNSTRQSETRIAIVIWMALLAVLSILIHFEFGWVFSVWPSFSSS